MAFNPKTEVLMDEIRAAVKERDAHLESVEEIVRRMTGRDYNTHRQSDMPITENFGFELLSILKPTIAYDNPRCQIQTAAPSTVDDATRAMMDQLKLEMGATTDKQLAQMMGFRTVHELAVSLGGMTMKIYAKSLELGLNRWSVANQIVKQLGDLAVDYLVCWGVALTTISDQPGYGGEEFVPQMPYLVRVAPQHHVFDSRAMSYDTTDANGPRFKGHMWRADKEDLLDDPEYDAEAVEDLVADNDVDNYYFNQDRSIGSTPRKEIYAWDIWLPEAQIDGFKIKDGYIGSWRTLALCGGKDGVTKRARELRKPRPAYVPEWGPYTMFGYHKVPNDPYPLSIMVATSEKAESLNAQTNAMAEDARRYKRIGVGNSSAINDAEKIRQAENGSVIVLDDPESFKQLEVGGTTDQQIKQANIERDSLERVSGLSSTKRGAPKGEVSATAEAISDQGSKTRGAGISSQYRLGVTQVMRTAAYYMVMGDDQRISIDGMDDDFPFDEFVGGLENRSKFKFHDLTLTIDPYSLEHTDQMFMKRNLLEIFTILRDSIPVIQQTPDFDWDEPMERLFEVANIQGAGDWVRDFLQTIREKAAQQEAMMGGQPQPAGGEAKGADLRLTNPHKEPSNPYEQVTNAKSASNTLGSSL